MQLKLSSILVASSLSLIMLGCSRSSSASSTPAISSSTLAQSPQQVTQPQEPLQIPNLEQGMTYSQARQLVIDAGWEPIATTTDNPSDGTDAWRKQGYSEVVACSGTGMGFCRFEFSGATDRRLVIVTGGRDSTVQKWWEEKNVDESNLNR